MSSPPSMLDGSAGSVAVASPPPDAVRTVQIALAASVAYGLTIPFVTGGASLLVPLLVAPLHVGAQVALVTVPPLVVAQELADLDVSLETTLQALSAGVRDASALLLAAIPVALLFGTGHGSVWDWVGAYYLGGLCALALGLWRAGSLLAATDPERPVAARWVAIVWAGVAFLVALPSAVNAWTLLRGVL